MLKVEYSETTFERLIVENQQMIHKICNIYGSNEADKEDLFQEITLQLWRSFKSFMEKSKFSTWLYRVALNTAISQKRKQNRTPESTSLSDREFQVPDASAEASNEEDMKQLRSAMRQIKSLDRAVIFLYLEEKSYQEIADIIGITTKNVGVKDCENQSQVVTNNEVKSWKIMVLSVFQKPGKGQRRLIAQKNCIQ